MKPTARIPEGVKAMCSKPSMPPLLCVLLKMVLPVVLLSLSMALLLESIPLIKYPSVTSSAELPIFLLPEPSCFFQSRVPSALVLTTKIRALEPGIPVSPTCRKPPSWHSMM